ncbi:MAG: antibiotic biosynthesis monooxygenase [Syntrophales bacterium]|jgi:quinol monooxygenase YgiN|nr:antibiotic biosynthesis monooxygenase [Syntrophales bacterium]MDY0043581.1 putative quinol monooxygenase [Syntrophales bacterium]
MITVTIKMKVISEKRKELSQTIASLIRHIRTEAGCLDCALYENVEDKNEFCLIEEWSGEISLHNHFESDRFRVLRGAMNLLREPYEIKCHTIFHTAERQEI